MQLYNLEERIIQLNNPIERKRIKNFLKEQGLDYDHDIEYTIAFLHENKIIATGSFSGKVLKCIAVDSKYKELGLSNKVVSLLVSEEYQRGRTHLFIYTKPSNYKMFSDMGFYKIIELPEKVVLMENDPNGIKKYIDEISNLKRKGKIISSIVMNCNPFTLGHQYLIEKAASISDVLHIFVVWEDKSTFPPEVRYKLIKNGTKHISNVIVHKGKDYIISNATFPSYFIKEGKEIVKTHAFLDLKIFSEYIAPSLNINRRFVGEEPYCPVTKAYNEAMKKLLPEYGIEVVEIPRFTVKGTPVSASKVREFLKKEEFSNIQELVPKTTYDYLISNDAKPIIKKMKNSAGRH
jgi:[citrate (pro-3S)-lyase] ligase